MPGLAKYVFKCFGLFWKKESVASIRLFLIRLSDYYFVNSAWPCETNIPKKLCSDGDGDIGRLNLAMCFSTAWLNHCSTCVICNFTFTSAFAFTLHLHLHLHAIITHLHAYIHIYMHAYTFTCIHTYTIIHTYIHTYVRTYVRTYIHTYIHTCVRKHVHTSLPTYQHTYAYRYIPIHTYV